MALSLIACGPDVPDALRASIEIPMGAAAAEYEDRGQGKWVRFDGWRDVQAERDDVLACIERDQTHKQEASG